MASDEQQCPDGGACHHDCKERCFRVETCEPLSGVYPGNAWPAGVRLAPRPVPLDEFGNPLDHHHDGKPVTLGNLCRLEPAWAANQILGLRKEVEHMKVRLHDEQACGDYSEELRDRTALREAATAFQIRIEELEIENTQMRETIRLVGGDKVLVAEERRRRQEQVEKLKSDLAGSDTMRECYSDELCDISQVVPPGEHGRHLSHQGALLQRVEDLVGRRDYLEEWAAKQSCEKPHEKWGEKFEVAWGENRQMVTSTPCGKCPPCQAKVVLGQDLKPTTRTV